MTCGSRPLESPDLIKIQNGIQNLIGYHYTQVGPTWSKFYKKVTHNFVFVFIFEFVFIFVFMAQFMQMLYQFTFPDILEKKKKKSLLTLQLFGDIKKSSMITFFLGFP